MVGRCETAKSCMMLITRVGEGRVYRCKTCMKEFSSFQALGGHRASHRKPVEQSLTKKAKTSTSHTCPICGVEFPMGQALGGHMRKHRNDKTGLLVTRSLLPDSISTTTLKKSNGGKRVACLDSMDSLINLNLELGISIY